MWTTDLTDLGVVSSGSGQDLYVRLAAADLGAFHSASPLLMPHQTLFLLKYGCWFRPLFRLRNTLIYSKPNSMNDRFFVNNFF